MNEYIHTVKIGNSNKSISLELYDDKFSIVSTWEGRDGSVKPNWVYRQERVDGENVPGKAIPLKLFLGEKEVAAKLLLQIVAAIGVGTNENSDGDESIPF